jgi:phenylalanyl-tRNA synthetase beta chain
MKFSLKWISQYVNWSEAVGTPQELANRLTKAGLEVDSIEDLAASFKNVVIGQILEKGQHPNADKLTLCQVTTGGGIVHQIVCGAKNHQANDKVVVALPGAILPGNFQIKLSKIRDVESAGMLCSQKELGLSEESEGIMILPEDAKVGEEFATYFGLNDVVMEVNVTSNRADCLSHFGLAREIASVLNLKCTLDVPELKPLDGAANGPIALDVRQPQLCPRYAGQSIKNVKVGPSPDWLKKSLEAAGMKSINNVVDITNYVMLELGQPLHAFDVRNIKGSQIVVDLARKGEKFTTLDGTELTLDGTELTIRDSERAVALAGIVGGQNSGIQDDTTEVFLESAYFLPQQVRRASRGHGIDTDSCYRFSRGVDVEGVNRALNRAALLMEEHARGQAFAKKTDFYPNPLKKEEVKIDYSYVQQRLGFPVDSGKFKNWITALGCKVLDSTDQTVTLLPPSFRQDLHIQEDFVEEYARLEGYENIPDGNPFVARVLKSHETKYLLGRKVAKVMTGLGYSQSINYAFTDKAREDFTLGNKDVLRAQGLKVAQAPIPLKNPLSEEHGVMRSSLVTDLLANLSHNFHQGLDQGRLFEIGYGAEKTEDGFFEEWKLAGVIWGDFKDLWQKTEVPIGLRLKSEVEELLKSFAIGSVKWLTDKGHPDFLHPGQSATLMAEGQLVGALGTLHPLLASKLKLRVPAAVFEFSLDRLMRGQPRATKAKVFSKFPTMSRDLAFVIQKSVPQSEVEQLIQKTAGKDLKSIELFDVFEGANVGEGNRSLAFRLTFQSDQGTLTDEAVNKVQQAVIDAVSKKLGARVR